MKSLLSFSGPFLVESQQLEKLGPPRKLSSFEPTLNGKLIEWVAGFLDVNGYVLWGSPSTALHNAGIEKALGIKRGSLTDSQRDRFLSSTGLIRFTSGDYFETPLLEIHIMPTATQIRSIKQIWEYVSASSRWSKYGLEYELVSKNRKLHREGLLFSMGNLMRDCESFQFGTNDEETEEYIQFKKCALAIVGIKPIRDILDLLQIKLFGQSVELIQWKKI